MKTSLSVIALIFGFVLSQTAFAGEAARGGRNGSGGSSSSAAELPNCVNDDAQLKDIGLWEQANSKTPMKYDHLKAAIGTDSDLQRMARLVYAETIAANCPADADTIRPAIATVVVNRVNDAKGDILKVVFARDQFASSMNIRETYPESKYKDFLCPQDPKLWAAAVRAVQRPPINEARHYFFLKHFDDRPAVAKGYNDTFLKAHAENTRLPFGGSEKVHDCIFVYR